LIKVKLAEAKLSGCSAADNFESYEQLGANNQ